MTLIDLTNDEALVLYEILYMVNSNGNILDLVPDEDRKHVRSVLRKVKEETA